MIDAERIRQQLEAAGYVCVGGLFATEPGVAFLLGVTERTLRRWRAAGTGPPAVHIGRWLFDLQELAVWIGAQSHRQLPERNGHARTAPATTPIDAGAGGRTDLTSTIR